MEAYQEYIVDSNEVIEFKFVRHVQDVESESIFNPDMSHQIFGDTETIFGYKGLKIKLYYTPGWLRTYFKVEYNHKAEPKDIVLAVDDVQGIITKFLEHDYHENLDLFLNTLKYEPKFKPFGEMINLFKLQHKECETIYEVYHISNKYQDKKFFEYYERLQNFIMWYIDCASFIDLDDDKWQHFIMYEKYRHQDEGLNAYAVVGFGTVYEYYAFPSHIRPRISQVMIFPPFRRQGLAAYLLNSIYQYYIPNKSVLDITVEGANLSFQKVRDFVDVCKCETLECLTPDKLKGGFNKDIAKELQTRFKINQKQARRVYEILLLRTINKFDENEMRNYRLQVKRRIHSELERAKRLPHNEYDNSDYPPLVQTDLSTKAARIEMLKNEYNDIEQQYYEVIERMESNPLLI